MGMRLSAETSAARLVGRLSRVVGRGGGTTLPGKLLWKVDPGALDALAARLPAGVAVVSATNGKTTTTPAGRRAARASSAPGSTFQSSFPGRVVPPPRPTARERRPTSRAADVSAESRIPMPSSLPAPQKWARSDDLALFAK
jgi:hypothetical protein